MTDDWLSRAEEKLRKMPEKAKEIRERAKNDLNFFATLVNPGYMYGEVHRNIYRWMEEYTLFGKHNDGFLTSNKLIMLPRAHLKSHMVATWCAWIITRHPEVTILYVSATAELAETQLYAIQNILSSKVYQQFFPEYINPSDGLREKWNTKKISIDHPERRRQGVRDATVATAGLTTNTTGWHADIIVADDIVVPENAYTEEGRDNVSKKASQFTSIRNPAGFTMACGTRYFPTDIYQTWKDQNYPIYNDEGEIIDRRPVWEIQEFAVEDMGVFLWPRVIRKDGKAFGFSQQILARIKAEYSDQGQFYAQYYNNPNEDSTNPITTDKFQYYDVKHLRKDGDRWFYSGKRLNIYAAVDFAFSYSKRADWTAIVVIGLDQDDNVYILDIDRFKTNKMIEYFQEIAKLHSKWKFNKLQAEVTVAQITIVQAIKDYVKQNGLTLSVVEYRPSHVEGRKRERIAAVLDYRYDNYKMWHYEGGLTPVLEEELLLAHPPHDDIKDALASALTIAIKPSASRSDIMKEFLNDTFAKKSRFGGMPYR